MPFGNDRNSSEQFVLQKIEYFKVMEYEGRSNWKRHYFKSYKEAVKLFKLLRKNNKKVLVFACRDDKLGERSTSINERLKNV
jgi:hypothetical protein